MPVVACCAGVMGVIEVAVWVHLENARLLVVQPAGSDVWFLPGGLIEPGESPEGAAAREAKEEVGVDLDPLAMELLTVIDDDAFGRPGVRMRLWCFTGSGLGTPKPLDEIGDLKFVSPEERSICAPAVCQVIDEIERRGWLT